MDRWYFMHAVESDAEPMDPQSGGNSPLREKPRMSSEWKCWKNVDGVVSTLRKHLKGTHYKEHECVCKLLNLKHVDKPADSTKDSTLNLSSTLLEVLQVLKHVFKEGHLDFTSYLIATEEDYSVESDRGSY